MKPVLLVSTIPKSGSSSPSGWIDDVMLGEGCDFAVVLDRDVSLVIVVGDESCRCLGFLRDAGPFGRSSVSYIIYTIITLEQHTLHTHKCYLLT